MTSCNSKTRSFNDNKAHRSGRGGQSLPQELGGLHGSPASRCVLLPHPKLRRALARSLLHRYHRCYYRLFSLWGVMHNPRLPVPPVRGSSIADRTQGGSLGRARPSLRGREDRCVGGIGAVPLTSNPRPQPSRAAGWGRGESNGGLGGRAR